MDDSTLVFGCSKTILRTFGARKIHVHVSCPPLAFQCLYEVNHMTYTMRSGLDIKDFFSYDSYAHLLIHDLNYLLRSEAEKF